MKVILFRSNNIFDSRVSKYVNYYRQAGIDFLAVSWDRNLEGLQRDHYDFFRYKAGVGVGGVQAIKNHTKWMLFVYNYLKRHNDVTTIHACDLNSAFPAALFKKRYNHRLKLIFDACDWTSANLGTNKLLRRTFERMEEFTYKWSNELIICEKERKAQVTFPLRKPPLVMPNIPQIEENLVVGSNERYRFNNDWPVLAYFGLLSSERFIVELLDVAKSEKVNLLIGGYGQKEVETKLAEMKECKNIRWFGKMAMKDGLQMSNAADAIYAMYCKTSPNNVYAAPNKYYEAMFLGKPLITTKGTILEKKILDNHTGYVVEESKEELKSLIRSLTKEDMARKGSYARQLWQNHYRFYIQDFFKNIYSTIIA